MKVDFLQRYMVIFWKHTWQSLLKPQDKDAKVKGNSELRIVTQ